MNFTSTRPHHVDGVSANIISDGCRDYVVAVEKFRGTELIRNWRGQVRRFASLAEAKRAVRGANVSEIKLSIRVAADEACVGESLTDSGFATVTLATKPPNKDFQ